MAATKYRKILWFQAASVLIAGLVMPFIGEHDFWILPDLIRAIVFEIFNLNLFYLVFIFPLVILAIFLAVLTWKYPKDEEMPRARFVGQLTGGALVFLPYFLFGFGSIAKGNAPQSLYVFILPLSVPFALPIIYGIGYYIGQKIAKAFKRN